MQADLVGSDGDKAVIPFLVSLSFCDDVESSLWKDGG